MFKILKTIGLFYMCVKVVQIVARGANGVIGNKGNIPWKLPSDLQYFKEKTMNHYCIVGRKTYEGIKHLKNRKFIVISKSIVPLNPDDVCFSNIQESIDYSKDKTKEAGNKRVYVIGGSEIYKETFDQTDILLVTQIEKEFEGDASYQIPDNFKLTDVSGLKSENGLLFLFTEYKRL